MPDGVNPPDHRVLRVRGVVQGVGFRPFVHRLATSLSLDGTVGNDSDGVIIEVSGLPADLDEFERGLVERTPPLAVVESITRERPGPPGPTPSGFRIIASAEGDAEHITSLPPDTAVCNQCLAEMNDPTDRRHLYPFVTCTECGPRFTITTSLPYDRPNTTMAGFPLCAACLAEYEDPADRRYHAQPLACPTCGPQLLLADQKGRVSHRGDDARRAGQRLLQQGAVVAVKGLGGYHLMCDATNPEAVGELRRRKQRGAKPFAVLVSTVADVDPAAHLSPAEAASLQSPRRPIVLTRRRVGAPDWVEHVAPGAAEAGVMLPCTPLQHLLLDGLTTRVLVCTSGNVADEPIVYEDGEALDRLAGLADAWLMHDRPIHTPCDDSVVRSVRGRPVPVRRARGYTPLPVHTGGDSPPLLAMGADLKGAVCVAVGGEAWMSQHLGDHGELATYRGARRAVEHLTSLTRITPAVVAVDAHPGYFSSRLGAELATSWGSELVRVQHHHAHVASVLAENGRAAPGLPPVIGVVFDGTGYGTDRTIWGGEILVATTSSFERAAHLSPVPLPGGDAAIEHPARTALAHLWAAGVEWNERLPSVAAVGDADRTVLLTQFVRSVQTVPTSSMGRLFDAVASLTGLRHRVDFEAQAAIELQAAADPTALGSYSFGPLGASGAVDAAPVVASVAADVLRGVPAGVVSMRFHRAVVNLVVQLADRLRVTQGLQTVALSGGVFQNALLLEGCIEHLESDGFEVLWHRDVPTNDGGLALGQAAVAASTMKAMKAKRDGV